MTDKNEDKNTVKGKTHYAPNKLHHRWNNEIPPTMTIKSGDVVIYELPDVSNCQMHHEATVDTYINLDYNLMHPLVGPIYIEEAKPGDTLEIEILDIHTKGWGWTIAVPGKGLLGDELENHYLRVFDLSNGDYIPFNDYIQVPIEPFLGTMGVAPAEKGEFGIIPPNYHGGNMDVRSLTKGARLYLPVQVPGALFSTGDGHAAQGDGEVSLTAVESPTYAALRFKVNKDKKISSPHFLTAPNTNKNSIEDKGYYATTGIGPDLKECARDAIRNMIDYLRREHKLSWEDAYILCSIAANLRINEIVDMPNYVVSAYLPVGIFKY